MGLAVCVRPHVRGQVITEFSVPTPASGPQGIAAGPDGNLWFTERNASKIGQITPDGTFTEFPLATTGRQPGFIVVGPDDDLWFTQPGKNLVGKITTAGTLFDYALPSPNRNIYGIRNDGAFVTFTEHWSTPPPFPRTFEKLGHLTTSGVYSEYNYNASCLARRIVPGWIPCGANNTVVGAGFTYLVPTPNSVPLAVVVGPDGNGWFTESLGNNIGRANAADGTVTEFPIPTPQSGPSGITSGPDGNLWFTEEGAGKIGRITTDGVITEFDIPTPNSVPRDITTGPDMALWFTENAGNKIGRITTSDATPTPTPSGSPAPTKTPTPTPSASSTPTPSASSTPTPTSTPPLQVLSIFPASGPASGGTSVAVIGSGFLPGASLTIGGVMAESVVVIGETEIDASAPPLGAGSLNDVAVENAGARPDEPLDSASIAQGWLADFSDVLQDDIFHSDVEKVFRHGITAGCGGGAYCRNASVTRAQMAVFLLKGEHGAEFVPPPCTGIFLDVTCPSPFADWIERLATEGITAGCGVGNYCPGASVTRAQMAVFLLKTAHGSSFVPPACTGLFADVECAPDPAFAVNWIEELFVEGVTGGCSSSPLEFCPSSPVARGQMAAFLVKAFGLP